MAAALAERQAPAFPNHSSGSFPDFTAFFPTPTPGATSSENFYGPPDQWQTVSQSWVQSVSLIAPSGTVGGSILITSVLEPQPTALSFSPPGPELSWPLESFTSLPSQPLPTIIQPSSQSYQFSFTRSPLAHSSDRTLSTSSDPIPETSTSLSTSSDPTTSITTSSSTATTSTPHTSISSQTSSSRTSTDISQESVTSPGDARRTKPAGIGAGGIAAVSISMGGLALLIGLALLVYCHHRRHRRPKSPQVYPEEAYLYDPPIIPSDQNGPVETTEYRRAGDTGSVYGMRGESLVSAGLVRPPTPEESPERESLLSRARRGSRPRTASSSLMNAQPPGSAGARTVSAGGGGVGGASGVGGVATAAGTGGGPQLGPLPPLSALAVRGILSPISPRGYELAPTEEADVTDRDVQQPENPFEEPRPEEPFHDEPAHDPFEDPTDIPYSDGNLVVLNPDETQSQVST